MNLVRSFGSLFTRRAGEGRRRGYARPAVPVYRPALEGLEDRVVMSAASALSPPALAPALAAPTLAQATSLLPLTVNSVANQAGSLVANASLGSTNFPIPLTLGTSPAQAAGSTPILNLHLDPIHLNLLGLQVDTSQICLNITANPSGGVLGALLSDVANALNGGTSLGQILDNLTAAGTLSTLTTGLTNLLNGAFNNLTSLTNALSGASVSSAGSTNILHLAVGPLNLQLLGLDVTLDNCANGPVTVDITAQSGPGQLLGNLLGGLSHLLDSNAATTALLNKLTKIADSILAIL